MKLEGIPFEVFEWSSIAATAHRGEHGEARWQTLERGNVRVRIVEYSPGYLADHWCARGHVIHVLAGELITELDDGRTFTIREGQGYVVADGDGKHRSRTPAGARLLVVD